MSLAQNARDLDTVKQEINSYFDEFCRRFETFDGAAVAGLFSAPSLARYVHGSARVFANLDEVERYYQSALDQYRQEGCSSCRCDELDVKLLSGGIVAAKVCWHLLDDAKTTRRCWSQVYFLDSTDSGWKCFASSMV